MPCSVSTSRSSNRTGRFPASGSPTGFTVKHTITPCGATFAWWYSRFWDARVLFVLLGRSQSQSLCPFHQRARSEAPLLHRHYPVSTLLRASPPPTRPGLALAGCPLRLPPLSPSVSRASCAFLRCMLSLSTPVELQSAFVTDFLCNIGLPRVSVGSAPTTRVSRPHRAFTCVTACIFAGSPSDPFHQRLRQLPLRLLLGK